MCNEKKDKPSDCSDKKEALQHLMRNKEFEITQLVQRNNFFMVFQGVLFAGLLQSSHLLPIVSLVVCFAGVFVSLMQMRTAAGAKFWQDHWLARIKNNSLSDFHEKTDAVKFVKDTWYKKVSPFTVGYWVTQGYSVSSTPIYTAAAFSAAWIFLVFYFLHSLIK